ncbi:RING-H2 finger protein ATL32 [Carex littledalei]|uniref:RING-H2 finger protein ATL32 n=1 Tax=Carex littledalei TaxID=544730 RepID=A0A833RB75_9POAL|nr:RING-H2 finger protein ATL32 [Carex littledalei]
MNVLSLYLVCLICFVLAVFFIFLLITLFGSCCKRCIDRVRDNRHRLPRRNPMRNMQLPTLWSLWPSRNSASGNIPPATRLRSHIISSVHRMPRAAPRPSNAANATTANAPPATDQSQRTTAPLPSGPRQSRVPMPCGCWIHQNRALAPMRYGPNPSNGGTDIPLTILQSPITAHTIHGPHQSQTMTPMRYGSHTIVRAHTPHGPHQSNSRQPQMLTPEPREGPQSRNSDINNAYISTFIYQKYEDNKNTECVVCLNELKNGEKVMRMPVCSHLYHQKCIVLWLVQEPSCPLCRSPVKLSVSVG